ncbi:hypothetical protein LCGC14_1160440 [marine sediment metagenome]|uniref:Uncharacterized protein n=1 Tax=marine sediment metagenome TaxID=412755 RepID=A0A0F9PB32_9ZZZZ
MADNMSSSKKPDGAKNQMPSEKVKPVTKEGDNLDIASEKTGVHIKPS